jgi:hypothetical protein
MRAGSLGDAGFYRAIKIAKDRYRFAFRVRVGDLAAPARGNPHPVAAGAAADPYAAFWLRVRR